ncbi:homoprotocatechuate degradation operon regulator HpaR [Rhodobacter ferrooxidans]|uniref:Transcriptional regulator, MarR family n=1 Tax=Rhodobacter ferrooxidans TaxID=371731 RepID=C8RXA0_9RHOB|nr:homoprotocatechuate degradation operon regulator HpaR [Rhodobacter sp. SW2]EEW26625.1 transcriptional regulator, MarR family [Rhodobacter sp. SW2]
MKHDLTPEGDTILTRDTRASLPMSLLRAREAVMARFRPILAAEDINEQQWRVIRVLAEAGRLDASEVAARANILAPSLTRMIRAMSDRGLIIKTGDAGDRRRVLLEIAPKGEALIRAVSPHSLRAYAELEAQFGPERIDALLALLNDLAALSEDRT